MIQFPQEYFEDEVIDGFYVPAIIKQLWGVNLDILEEVDRVCKKHGIKYFADWGSLLATVRHQGNIPWDDDIDICMMRSDYERFLEVAKKDLSPGFEVYNNDNRDEHWLFLARVINKNRICFEDEHLKRFHNFPYIASVDIFILDYWYEDQEQRKKQKDDFYFTFALAEKAELITHINENVEYRLRHIEAITGEKVDRSLKGIFLKRRLFKLCDAIMARCSEEEASGISQLVPFGFTKGFHFDKQAYESSITLPYDEFKIEAPVQYEKMLRMRYGQSYGVVRKMWDGHDYPHFKKQHEKLTEIMDMNGFAYHFDKTQLPEFAPKEEEGGYKPLCVECYNGLYELLEAAFNSASDEDAIASLQESQQLAIDLGTLIEQAKGEGTATVAALEQYCEALYNVCTGALGMGELADGLNAIGANLNAEILGKKEIVFLATKAGWWRYFEPTYSRYINDPKWNVVVIEAPYFYKNYDGSMNKMHIEEGSYPDYVQLTNANDYNLFLNHPDIIVFQSSFDQWNPTTCVLPELYSEKLRAAADSLIYIPPYDVEDFAPENEIDYYNLSAFLCMPGVMRADEVWVASETLRHTYVQKLVDFAGEEYKSIFENKIKLAPEGTFAQGFKPTTKASDITSIIYFISADYLVRNGQEGLERIQKNMAKMGEKSASSNVRIIFAPHPQLEAATKSLQPELYEKYMALKEEVRLAKFVEIDDITDVARSEEFLSKADAYYGDGSHLQMLFLKAKKPVIMQRE